MTITLPLHVLMTHDTLVYFTLRSLTTLRSALPIHTLATLLVTLSQ